LELLEGNFSTNGDLKAIYSGTQLLINKKWQNMSYVLLKSQQSF